MQYSQVSISNLALLRIGARGQIADINENSPNAVKLLAIWDAIFQEVLSERDWKFAKTRTQLQLTTLVPLYTYRFAWAMPADFLRFVRPQKKPHRHNLFFWGWGGPEGWGWYHREDPPFWPCGVDWKVEAVPQTVNNVTTWQQCVLTNYDGLQDSNGNPQAPASITYIRLITDYTQLLPGFVNCLANRLAQELAISVTEDKQKLEIYEQRYKDSLNSAEAQNETMDLVSFDEAGSTSWVSAGRWVGWW